MPSQFNTLADARVATGVMPHTPGRRFGQGLLAAAALAASITAGSPALADSGYAWVSELDEATIKVASDGERYTTVLNSSPAITGVMKMSLNAHRDGFVRWWKLWSSIQAQNMPKKQFPDLNYSKNYRLSERIKEVRRELPFSIPRQAYQAYAEEACNELAKDLQLLHGKTDAEIFAEDRSIAVEAGAEVSWDMSGIVESQPPLGEISGSGEPDPKIKPVTILCMKTPPAPPAVTSAALVVQGLDPVSLGRCHMRLNGVLRSNLPNLDVTFRYADKEGNVSDLKTVTTDSDRRASFEHRYPLSPGQKSTEIRIVGQNLNFTSAWKAFDYNCEEGSQIDDFATLLPPEPVSLGYTVYKEAFHAGRICPTEITIRGQAVGRGKASGNIEFRAAGYQIALAPYSFQDDETRVFVGKHQVSWHEKPATEQNIELGMILYNAAGDSIDHLQRMETIACRDQQLVSGDPTPPVLGLSASLGKERLYEGFMCPEVVRLSAGIIGQGSFDGRAIVITKQEQSLFEAQRQVEEFNFAVEGSEVLEQIVEPLVKWRNVPTNGDAPPKQTLDFAFRVVRNGATMASFEQSMEVRCKAVNLVGTAISFDPPKVFSLQVASTRDEILYQGRICPARVRLTGSYTGQGIASGNAMLGANGRFVAQDSYDIEDGVTEIIRGEYTLNWVGVQGPVEQDVEFVLRLDDAEGGEVDTMTKSQTFACRKPELTRADANRVDGLSTGNPSIPHSQQAGRPAAPGNGAEGQFALQTGPAFAIQAPKGRVRAGRVQLSGGAADAKYDLRFYREAEGGYRMVRSAQLPRQMTGRTATFNLKALSGSRDWRIEVCPAGSNNKRACKTSEFQLPSQRSNSKGSPRADTGGTRVFILPGQGG